MNDRDRPSPVMLRVLILILGILTTTPAPAAEGAPPGADTPPGRGKLVPSDDADGTWRRLATQAGQQPKPAWTEKMPTPEQVKAWRLETMSWAGRTADLAATFEQQFPKHPQVGEARAIRLRMLRLAGNYGDTARRATLKELQDQMLADPKISPDQKADLRVERLQESLARVRGQSRAAYLEAYAAGLMEIQRELPGAARLYPLLYAAAQSTTNSAAARQMVTVITNSPVAASELKAQAHAILNRTSISPPDRKGLPPVQAP